MLILIKTGITAAFVVLLSFAPITTVQAADIDFSCMSHKVWPKSHLSNRYRGFDVVLQNNCPGPVYWSMCIERINAESSSVWETLKPSGYVEAEKKARVNLQTKKNKGKTTFRQRYEEFYVNIGYSIESAASVECVANACEASKRDLRKAIQSNEMDWEKAERALQSKIASECPDTGWDTATRQECELQVRSDSAEQIGQFSDRDAELREQMAAIDPDRCTVYSGALVNE
jgi:hypothetical protein